MDTERDNGIVSTTTLSQQEQQLPSNLVSCRLASTTLHQCDAKAARSTTHIQTIAISAEGARTTATRVAQHYYSSEMKPTWTAEDMSSSLLSTVRTEPGPRFLPPGKQA
ncbi:hypothetical protein BST61_g9425 [Cercospora zeina]